MGAIDYPLYNFSTSVADAGGGTDEEFRAMSPIATITRTLESGERWQRLGLNSVFNFTTPKSLTTINDATTAYQVPTGFTAKVIVVVKGNSLNDDTPIIREDTVADAGTGTIKFQASGFDKLGSDLNNLVTFSPDWHNPEVSFAAGNYITMHVDAATKEAIVVFAMAIETPT